MSQKKYLLIILLLVSIALTSHLVLSGTEYHVRVYPSDPSATKGLYSYDLGDLRLLFSRDMKKNDGNDHMHLLHQNNFWNSERCAGMIPSIFHDRAFFVESTVVTRKDGILSKKSTVYDYNFASSTLKEISTTIPIVRVLRRDKETFVLRLVKNRVALLYRFDEARSDFIFDDFYIIPHGYTYRQKTNYLEWCNDKQLHCISKKEYIGFEDLHRNIHTYDEDVLRFSYKDQSLTISRTSGILFLGY